VLSPVKKQLTIAMSLPTNCALYYPQIEFSDYRWLWSAALLWDKIYRIEPDDFTPEHPDNIRALCDGGDIGIPIRPKEYAKTVAEEFMVHINTGKWQAAALEKNQVREYARIHHDKIDVRIRQMLISNGRAASHDQWLYVPDDFEKLYMTYLATKIAAKNNLQAVSDTSSAWAGLTYFTSGRLDTEMDDHKLPFALAAFTIGGFLPANITDITPGKLLAFRAKYSDERRNFMRAIKAAAVQLANCHDASVANEVLDIIQKDVAAATSDYKQSMDILNAKAFVGFATAAIPMISPVLGKLVPLAPLQLAILGTTVLTLGSIAGVATLKQKGKRLSRECDYSYLVQAEKAFLKNGDALDLPNRLRYDLNEFIND
jgi:hypothetical protein